MTPPIKKTIKSIPSHKYTTYACLILLLTTIYCTYKSWHSPSTILITILDWQKSANNELASLLHSIKKQPLTSSITLITVSFLYGVIHALGPGHGKLVVTTYLATHPAKINTSLIVTIASAILQGLTAIALVTTLRFLLNDSTESVNVQSHLLHSASSILIIILGMLTIYRSIHKKPSIKKRKPKIIHITHLPSHPDHKKPSLFSTINITPPKKTSPKCTHCHIASAQSINNANNLTDYIAIIISIGIRPCSGSILILTFSHFINTYWAGIISSLIMSLGTAITTSCIALLTITGKKITTHHSGNKKTNSHLGKILQLIGGLILIMLGASFILGQSLSTSPLLQKMTNF